MLLPLAKIQKWGYQINFDENEITGDNEVKILGVKIDYQLKHTFLKFVKIIKGVKGN